MKKVWFFIDDSGVLHHNAPNDIFVYAGYSFINNEKKKTLNVDISFYRKKSTIALVYMAK
ncbi:hypothetical protein [Xylocopilactobacillus apis]|uniref:Uncharacterized protein n=1 Tax=Xylocopilactobacillus apis TaxID=2932183 RepID=A0AAU9D763_9LACO|nr:hypothetical protein [Xylocopilactobacillus apis]BDR55500.1 hypothetical protein KIMC2_00620 [Xylocopilactobacillus apis]